MKNFYSVFLPLITLQKIVRIICQTNIKSKYGSFVHKFWMIESYQKLFFKRIFWNFLSIEISQTKIKFILFNSCLIFFLLTYQILWIHILYDYSYHYHLILSVWQLIHTSKYKIIQHRNLFLLIEHGCHN